MTDETKEQEKEARSLRRRAKANQAVGRLMGDDERQARGKTQETLAEMREYASTLGETSRRDAPKRED